MGAKCATYSVVELLFINGSYSKTAFAVAYYDG
jgi:hypothetical protein